MLFNHTLVKLSDRRISLVMFTNNNRTIYLSNKSFNALKENKGVEYDKKLFIVSHSTLPKDWTRKINMVYQTRQ